MHTVQLAHLSRWFLCLVSLALCGCEPLSPGSEKGIRAEIEEWLAAQQSRSAGEDAGQPDATSATKTKPDDEPSPPQKPPVKPVAERMRSKDMMPQIKVPAGSFVMGSDKGRADQQPKRRVSFRKDFWLDRHEVTVGQWQGCMNAGGCSKADVARNDKAPKCNLALKYEQHPINCVSWKGARDYCRWVAGALPTEAQWEYAARGKESFTWPWGDGRRTCGLAVTTRRGDCELLGTDPVENRPGGASPFGAMDMTGNVREWVVDTYVADAYKRLPAVDPVFRAKGKERVHRGGSYNEQDKSLLPTHRQRSFKGVRTSYIGFRCVSPR